MKHGKNQTILGLGRVLKSGFLKIVFLGILILKVCFLFFVLFITGITSFWTSHSLHRRIINILIEELG